MAATICAANTPFYNRLRLPLSPRFTSLPLKCSINPLNINREELLNIDENDGLDKATQRVQPAKNELAQAENHHQVDEDAVMVLKNKEKLESIKAASISAIVGTFASLPISLTQATNSSELLILTTATTIISCALYGATFRYTVRRDLDDFHLKTGTCAAFGIVKGLAALDVTTNAFDGAVYVLENILIFLFAAAGLDICFKLGILSPFPFQRSVSRTKM